jgi:Fur family peroxide stress response transcriptional regulator
MTREERLGVYEQVCRQKGLTMTVQRRVILKELVQRADHPTANQIYESVKERLPGLSRTTIYRVLDTFVRVGAAHKVFHPDAVVRFDPIRERHHHLFCRRCGDLFDLEDSVVKEIRLRESPEGFEIHDYSIHFTGICVGCRNS